MHLRDSIPTVAERKAHSTDFRWKLSPGLVEEAAAAILIQSGFNRA